MNPRVSVIIPAHNRAGVIGRAISSVCRQTFCDLEVIVVDDASSDSTPYEVSQHQRDDERIRLVKMAVRGGAQAARNAGLRAARGEWVAFLDSDDHWLPESLERRMKTLREEGTEVVHSECYVVREGMEPQPFGVPGFSGSIYRDVLQRPGPMFQALVAKRSAFETIGYLDEEIVSYQEWDTSIRLAGQVDRWSFVAEPTFYWDFTRDDSISKDRLRNARGYAQVVRKHRKAILMHLGPPGLASHYRALLEAYKGASSFMPATRLRVVLIFLSLIDAKWWGAAGRRLPVIGGKK